MNCVNYYTESPPHVSLHNSHITITHTSRPSQSSKNNAGQYRLSAGRAKSARFVSRQNDLQNDKVLYSTRPKTAGGVVQDKLWKLSPPGGMGGGNGEPAITQESHDNTVDEEMQHSIVCEHTRILD